MPRGDYDFVRDFSSYADVDKAWYIELQLAKYYWFDLIDDPPDTIKELRPIASYLSDFKKMVEKELEKRFIYFFCSRTKVRFDVQKKPRFSSKTGYLKIHLIIRGNSKKTINVKFIDEEKDNLYESICEISDKFICFYNTVGGSVTFSVHDFLDHNCIDLGYPTKVHYVGITKNPDTRPLNRQHRGVADTLYRVSNDENDFFIVINVFKVTTLAPNKKGDINFIVSNAATDEISVNREGELIEKAFVAYFDSDIQKEEQSHERSSLFSLLKSIKKESKIDRILFDYEGLCPSVR